MSEGYFDRRWQAWRWEDGPAGERPDDDHRDDHRDDEWDDDRWEAMRRGRDRRPAEPAWLSDPTAEWVPLPGQRYPGDRGARRQPRRESDARPGVDRGRANVYQANPTRRQTPPLSDNERHGHTDGRQRDDIYRRDPSDGRTPRDDRRPDDRRPRDDRYVGGDHDDGWFSHDGRGRARAHSEYGEEPPAATGRMEQRRTDPSQRRPAEHRHGRPPAGGEQWDPRADQRLDGYRRDQPGRPPVDHRAGLPGWATPPREHADPIRPDPVHPDPARSGHGQDQRRVGPPPPGRPDARDRDAAEVYRVRPTESAGHAGPVRRPPYAEPPRTPADRRYDAPPAAPAEPTTTNRQATPYGRPAQPAEPTPYRQPAAYGSPRPQPPAEAPAPSARPPLGRPPAPTPPPRRVVAADQTGEHLPIPVSAPAGPPPEFRVKAQTGEHPEIRPAPSGTEADAPGYVVRAKAEPRHAPPPYIVRERTDPVDAAPIVASPPAGAPTPVPRPAPAPAEPVTEGSRTPVGGPTPASVPPAAPVSPAPTRPADPPATEPEATVAPADPASGPSDADLDPAPARAGAAPDATADNQAELAAAADRTPPPTSAPTPSTSTPSTSTPTTDDEPARSEPPASADTVLPVAGTAAGAATALGAPTMLAPMVRPDGPSDAPDVTPPEPVAPVPADPEQVLSSYRWRFHHETLRELVENPDELRAIRDRLTEKIDPATDNGARARLLSLRAVVSRILGDLGKALSDAKLAVAHAEATGELRRIAIAQARLAHVLQWRGDFAEADRLFEEANSSELPDRLRATMHEHAGRSCYDQGRYMEACNHFERALELRKVEDPDLIARTELALDAVFAKVAENGWGPYPRDREEVLRLHRPPRPTFSDRMQRWGYAGADGDLVIAPAFADVQPFREGVAWVRRPEVQSWELIDESGQVLIGASAGYLGVGSFSDGLAWVSRDGTGAWIAIDRDDTVVIGTGYDDVRPFRRGVAVVRRGGWGAVDKTGRAVLPTRYGGFPTALTDGRYIDGFTDEGLAIVDAGGRKGVVDRSGRMIVAPVHPAMAIHPVAFLIAGPDGKWGALDRRGEPLIDPVHPSRGDVMDEIDRLLADTKPVL
ncbi:WG repeat-containing protein [Solwaraspora sp. WMMD406]|uniref:WG repeat-containing protein n=1 Tax=Solwaraspora sp. WMMD406 TaxID=3016095 RepID=UPI0024165CEB|nr:WG repeat-containing protein [Solwaraspora sp. WMMD406]MDG4765132.1 WG repeat-containing protein [Solwaraspora sp. WMMD406]